MKTIVGCCVALGLFAALTWLLIIHNLVFPVYGCAFGLLWLSFTVAERREMRRRQREGYWVEILTPGQLRAGEDEWAIYYHEGSQYLSFPGIMIPNEPNVLYVPSEQKWPRSVPSWAADKREVILSRIRQRLHPKFGRIEENDS